MIELMIVFLMIVICFKIFILVEFGFVNICYNVYLY